jgi:bacillithiol biosynthesis deacetylase BshB1
MPCDLLVFAPHPDDAEIHCGALIARATRLGLRAVVVDATRGEMGSRGTAGERASEAEAAAAVLGLAERRTLGLPDGALDDRDAQARLAVVETIRELQPKLVLVNHPHCQHPDHRALARLLLDVFKASELHRLPGSRFPAWRGARLACYEAELAIRPDLLIGCDEGDWECKLAAIRCYRSQLAGSEGPTTSIAQPSFLRWIESRGRVWGQQAGRDYGEALAQGLAPLALDDFAGL